MTDSRQLQFRYRFAHQDWHVATDSSSLEFSQLPVGVHDLFAPAPESSLSTLMRPQTLLHRVNDLLGD